MTDLNSVPQASFPLYPEVDPILVKSLEREFSSLQEMSKLFMLKYANSISLIYKNKLDEKIKVNPKLDCFDTGFSCLLYNMKKKFMDLMKEELEKLRDFFYEFVNLKEKDYIFGKLFKKNFQNDFCLEVYPDEHLRQLEQFFLSESSISPELLRQETVEPQNNNVRDFEIQEAGSEMSHLEFDQSPHSTLMVKKRKADDVLMEKHKKSPNFAHEEMLTPQRSIQKSVHKSPKFYKRSLEGYSDLENKNPNIQKMYQPRSLKERSKEKMIPRVPKPKPPIMNTGSTYKDIESQGVMAGQRSPRNWESSKHSYSNSNSIKTRDSHQASLDVGDPVRNERFVKKDKSYYQNASKSRRSREILEEAQIEKYGGGGRRSRERLSRRFMDVKNKEVKTNRKVFDIVKKSLGEEEAVLAFEIIDEETIVYSILDQGIFLDKFTTSEELEEPQRNYKILISEHLEVIDIQYDQINENLYYFSAKANAVYKHNLKNGENMILLETSIPIDNESLNPAQTIIQLDNEAGYLIAKTQKNELTFIDLLSPRKRISAEIEDDSRIIYFKPFLNGSHDMLILTNEGIVKILRYENLSIELIKTSDNLELEGEVTACSFNIREMILVISQFVDGDVSSNYKNSTRIYKIKLNSWIWIEFLTEFKSDTFQSKMSFNSSVNCELAYKGNIVITSTRARGSHDFSSFALTEDNRVVELVPKFGLKTAGVMISKHYNNRLWTLSEDSTLCVISPLT